MAGTCKRWKMYQLVVALTVAVTFIQVQSVVSQNCNESKVGECCRATTPTCPSGYFRDVNCDVTFPPPTPTPSEAGATSTNDEIFNTTADSDASTTDSSFTAEDDNRTESSSDQTPTVPPITPPLGVNCRRCGDNCVRCNATFCIECQQGYVTGNGSCVISQAQDKKTFPVGAVAGGVVGGVVLIVVIVVVAVCCCHHRKRSDTSNLDGMLRERAESGCSDVDEQAVSNSPETNRTIHPVYENLAFKQDDLPTKIQRKQDDVLRYTRDPTANLTPVTNPPSFEVEEEETYGNQVMIIRNEIDQLPQAPAPPPGAQSTQKKRQGKTTLTEPEVVRVEEDEPQEIYYNDPDNSMAGLRALGTEYEEEQELYYNESAGENLYENYTPPKK